MILLHGRPWASSAAACSPNDRLRFAGPAKCREGGIILFSGLSGLGAVALIASLTSAGVSHLQFFTSRAQALLT